MRSIAVSSVMIAVTFLDSPFVKQSCVTKIELTMVLERGEVAIAVTGDSKIDLIPSLRVGACQLIRHSKEWIQHGTPGEK